MTDQSTITTTEWIFTWKHSLKRDNWLKVLITCVLIASIQEESR